jgi:hypothetical protein
MSTSRSIGRLVTWVVVIAVVGTTAAVATARGGGGAAGAASRTPARSATSSELVAQLALARAATAKYVTNLQQAKADGYGVITKMIPNMGYHYMNANVKGFDVRKPPILVYEHQGNTWQLGAIEWVFPSKPAKPPLPGARYGAFGAGCHYLDGSFYPADSQDACPKTAPNTGAAFNFWHPPLVTLHVWLWYPNPSGLFASTNPLVAPFNRG